MSICQQRWGQKEPFCKGLELQVVCVGSTNWDIVGLSEQSFEHGADRPGRIVRRAGGVAFNVATEMARQGVKVALLTAVGDDAAGDEILAAGPGVVVDYACRCAGIGTDNYMAIEGANGMAAAVADVRCLEAVGADVLQPLVDGTIASSERPWRRLMLVDGNLAPDLLADIAADPIFAQADLRVVSASNGKVERLACFLGRAHVSLYLNKTEANILLGTSNLTTTEAAIALTKSGLRASMVSDGANALAYCNAAGLYTQTPPKVDERLCTGAGDVLVAAHVAAELQGLGAQESLAYAAEAAAKHVAGGGV